MKYVSKNSLSSRRMLAALGAALVVSLGTAPTAMAQSIASKVEQLGQITVVQVSQMMSARRDGLLQVQFELTNTTDSNQRIRYRFKWLDSSGFTVWDEEPWKPVLVHGRQKTLQRVVAPTREASDFRIELHAEDNWGGDGSAPAPGSSSNTTLP